MRTIAVQVYQYSELNESAKEKVKRWLNQDDSDSLTELLEEDLKNYHGIPNATLSYSLSSCQGDGVSFTGRWSGENMLPILNKAYKGDIPKKLLKIIPYFDLKFERINHHYCHAYSVTTELYSDKWYGKHIEKLVAEAEEVIERMRLGICKELEKTGYKEIEYRYTDEYAQELCEANDYEFYSNGELI